MSAWWCPVARPLAAGTRTHLGWSKGERLSISATTFAHTGCAR